MTSRRQELKGALKVWNRKNRWEKDILDERVEQTRVVEIESSDFVSSSSSEHDDSESESEQDDEAPPPQRKTSVSLIRTSYRRRQRETEKKQALKQKSKKQQQSRRPVVKRGKETPTPEVKIDMMYLADLNYTKFCCDAQYRYDLLVQIRTALKDGQCVHICQNYSQESSLSEARLLLQQIIIESLSYCNAQQSMVPDFQSDQASIVLYPPKTSII